MGNTPTNAPYEGRFVERLVDWWEERPERALPAPVPAASARQGVGASAFAPARGRERRPPAGAELHGSRGARRSCFSTPTRSSRTRGRSCSTRSSTTARRSASSTTKALLPGESWAAKNVVGKHYEELAASGAFYRAESFEEVVAGHRARARGAGRAGRRPAARRARGRGRGRRARRRAGGRRDRRGRRSRRAGRCRADSHASGVGSRRSRERPGCRRRAPRARARRVRDRRRSRFRLPTGSDLGTYLRASFELRASEVVLPAGAARARAGHGRRLGGASRARARSPPRSRWRLLYALSILCWWRVARRVGAAAGPRARGAAARLPELRAPVPPARERRALRGRVRARRAAHGSARRVAHVRASRRGRARRLALLVLVRPVSQML